VYDLLEDEVVHCIYIELSEHTPRKYIKSSLVLNISNKLKTLYLSDYIIKTIKLTAYRYSIVAIKKVDLPMNKNITYTSKELVLQNFYNSSTRDDCGIEFFIWIGSKLSNIIVYINKKLYFSQQLLFDSSCDVQKIANAIIYTKSHKKIDADRYYLVGGNKSISEELANNLKRRVIAIDSRSILRIGKNRNSIAMKNTIFHNMPRLKIYVLVFFISILISFLYPAYIYLEYSKTLNNISFLEKKLSKISNEIMKQTSTIKDFENKNITDSDIVDSILALNAILQTNSIKLQRMEYKDNKITILPVGTLDIKTIKQLERLKINVE
jgi:hypothetical protein